MLDKIYTHKGKEYYVVKETTDTHTGFKYLTMSNDKTYGLKAFKEAFKEKI